jgi:hypothetical protein
MKKVLNLLCETIFQAFLHVFFILLPFSLRAKSHILRSVRWPPTETRTVTHARDHWWTLDFANAFLSPLVNSRAEWVPSPRAYARNDASRRWLGDETRYKINKLVHGKCFVLHFRTCMLLSFHKAHSLTLICIERLIRLYELGKETEVNWDITSCSDYDSSRQPVINLKYISQRFQWRLNQRHVVNKSGLKLINQRDDIHVYICRLSFLVCF